VAEAAETFVRYSSSAREDSKADIGTGACEVRQVRCILNPAVSSQRYLLFYDSLTAAGTIAWRMTVPQQGEGSETFSKGELDFATGFSVALSSTEDVLTATTASEAVFNIVVVT
jgi:hypothetical protein